MSTSQAGSFRVADKIVYPVTSLSTKSVIFSHVELVINPILN